MQRRTAQRGKLRLNGEDDNGDQQHAEASAESSTSSAPVQDDHDMLRRRAAILPVSRYLASPPPFRIKRPFATLAILVICLITLLYWRSDTLQVTLDPPIVTLASSAARLRSNELAITLRSLLHQTVAPSEIRLYLTEEDKEVFNWHKTHDKSRLSHYLNDERINLYYVKDVGPSTKFIYAIQDMLENGKQDHPLIVLDDDHSYSPDLVATLLAYSRLDTFRNAAVGLRGWRVRRDLHWGVSPDELEEHVADGWKLAEPFRVGVLTANEGYLIKPRFFLDSSRHQNFIKDWRVRAPVLDVQKLNETAAHLVDDIWLNGHLSARDVARYVVPLTPSSSSFSLSTFVLANDAVPSIDVTKAHTLEGRIQREGYTRTTANWVALRLFEDAWKAENLFYVTRMERRLVATPEARNLIPRFVGGARLARRGLLKLFHHIYIRLVFKQ